MDEYITNDVLNEVFYVDGSLRDIYVFNVSLSDWQKLFDWIRLSPWEVIFYKDGQVTLYKGTDVAKFFEEKESNGIHLMSININGVLVNCHFFSESEIEFDIDPKQVNSMSDANIVFEFMKKLSKMLGKESILTEENTPEYPLVTSESDGTLIINVC
ncbi:hypothetical protein [Litchfieldia salsa]|uniref:Uncharacterized protein n=1 Tax=Litchfieldia salsa TaxID=930152 RepID=A0A1H0SM59_9BACI|nr:hypothetical protein [Litchfieldia salsa]SDP42824.1 hypothetical protein SAMN05216565_10312 [Litchfieldia salsa]